MAAKTALITGASSGIGYELSFLFAQDKYNLVLIARSSEKLHELAKNLGTRYGIDTLVISKDLSEASAPEEIYQEVQQAGISIDVLVNNAGYGRYGSFVDTELEKELSMIQLNVVTLTHLTKLFLRDMRQQGSGKIMNVASTAAFQPGPLMAVYYATKAYVLSFSEALNNELADTEISVTALCPGPTVTDFQKTAAMEKSRLVSGKTLVLMDAARVAEAGYHGLMNNKALVIPGVMNKLLVSSLRLTPRFVVPHIVKFIQKES